MKDSFYRFVSEIEYKEIQTSKEIPTSRVDWTPYLSGTIVSIYKSNNIDILCEKYASALSDLRSLKPGESLILLEMADLHGKIEKDKSQNGWHESYAHLGPIPNKIITMVWKVALDIKGDIRKFDSLTPL